MRNFLIGLLMLGAMSTHAAEVYKMDRVGVTVLNDIVGAIKSTKEAAIFVKNVSFDEVSVDFSADRKDSIIEAKGMLFAGGDMACGELKIQIKRSYKFNGWESAVTYRATLDKSTLSDMPVCELQD